jgi:hypothetical protein
VNARVLASVAALIAPAALLVYAAPRASGYAESAPPGFSGGFGEQSCHACHFDADLNSGLGRIAIAGVPDRFAPDEPYQLTITLTRPDMKLGGFQLTARFKDSGAQAGSLAPAPGEEERVGIDVQSGIEYVNQRRKGTALASANSAAWKLIWTAPAANSAVVFHVAANAADGDETAEGDFIHTLAVEYAPVSTGPPYP